MSVGPPVELSVFIETVRNSKSPRWLGKVCDPISEVVYSRHAASCEVSDGIISLSLAAGIRGWLNDLSFEIPVGHALSMVLELGDRLELRRDGAGAWNYWVVRGDIFVIGVGAFNGKYGSSVELLWSDNIEDPTSRPVRTQLPKRYSRAIVKLEDLTFELREKQEATTGPYYVKCLNLGDDLRMMPSRAQEIAVLTTQRVEVRKAFSEFFLFQETCTKAYIAISSELFPSGRVAETKHLSHRHYELDRYRRLRQIENKMNQMYRDFGIRPLKSRLKVPSFRTRLFGWL